jgi:cbb3-type cytochrome oxidase subunit 1
MFPTTCCAGSAAVLYLAGALIMAYNVYMTIRGDGATRCRWAPANPNRGAG